MSASFRSRADGRLIIPNVFWGVAIIAIGLFMGGSIFFGDFSLFNMLFDGLGMFFIGKGLFGMLQKPEREQDGTASSPRRG